METIFQLDHSEVNHFYRALQFPTKIVQASLNNFVAQRDFWHGFFSHTQDFFKQLSIASEYFQAVERSRVAETSAEESFIAYCKLLEYNFSLSIEAFFASIQSVGNFVTDQWCSNYEALTNSFFGKEGTGIKALSDKNAKTMQTIANWKEQILAIKSSYGFHFDDGNYALIDETERFWLYQVFPFIEGRSQPQLCDDKIKPVVIIPPYVLGANILCFLRENGKSYVHSFANKGIPTFIRIIKPIDSTSAVAKMTQEDDCLDTAKFCQTIAKNHGGRKITLHGYCQGGYGAVVNWLSGKLDSSVDAVMTCVAPMDGTKSLELKKFLDNLPARFNDLAYGAKQSELGGEAVASGQLMSFVYKIKSLDRQAPVVAFFNDLTMIQKVIGDGNGKKLSPTVFALNHWLLYDRADIPMAITQVSFDSYNHPITKDGTLPVKLFDKKLNLRRFKQRKVPLAVFYAQFDDLVDPEVVLAAQKYTTFVGMLKGGHVKAATSPDSDDPNGPVQRHLMFQLVPADLLN